VAHASETRDRSYLFKLPPCEAESTDNEGVTNMKSQNVVKTMGALGTALSMALVLVSVAPVAMGATMASEKTVMVGGAAMYLTRNIIENAVNSKDHTTLVAAVTSRSMDKIARGVFF
jgi:uncharacterized surface protein with fasciclin (FAS1) repeats